MKYPALLFVFIFFIGAACSKDPVTRVTSVSGPEKSAGNLPSRDSGKRGTCFNTNNKNGVWSADVLHLNSHWFYTWLPGMPSDPTPANIQFVPMFWGRNDVFSTYIDSLKILKLQGKVSFVLGFNEPNRPDQAGMTVKEALSFWPKLQSVGLPLGSPATDWPTRPWFTEFMDSVKTEKLRVDFIAVHMYTGTDDVAFVKVLQDLYVKYHLPIWITEFGIADFNAKSIGANQYTPAQILAFMQRLLPKLEALPYVKRYAWFSGDPADPALGPSALVDSKGNLTPLGTWYAGYKP